MEYCKKCARYSEDFDELCRFYNDTDVDGGENTHFCILYKNGIPKEISEDKEGCKKHSKSLFYNK